jgi:hypothetical protein
MMIDGRIFAVIDRGGAVCALFTRELEAKIYHQTRIRRATNGEYRLMRIDDLREFLGVEFGVEIVED